MEERNQERDDRKREGKNRSRFQTPVDRWRNAVGEILRGVEEKIS